MGSGRDAAVQSLRDQGRWPRPDGDRWVDMLCDPEPWVAVPDEPLPRFLERSVWWNFEVPARVGLRHLRLRADPGRELEWLAHRYTHTAVDVAAFLQGAAEAAMEVADAVDLLLNAGGSDHSLAPLLASDAGRERVRAVASGQAKLGGRAGVTALSLLARTGDETLHDAVRSGALASSAELRACAQGFLVEQPDAGRWVAAQLGKGSAGRRAQAAELAGRLGGAGAVSALRARFPKEKTESVRVALLEALERLGVDVAEVLDRDALVDSMTAAAAKGTRPKGLDPGALPALRWSDGSDVPLGLVDAWIATCHKRKKPVPTPMLSVLARGLDRASAAPFAVALFRFWVELDHTDTDPYWGHQKGTATSDKGLFALVGALADHTIVDEVRTYVTTHYGWRSAQCKAMLAMLGHVGHPSAIQYLLQVGARFRTRGIKLAAQAEVEELANRRGWTRDELADRMLGEAGLDGEPLSYLGADEVPTRSFGLQLAPDLTIQVVDGAGQPLKGLPKGHTTEDPATVKAAKRRLTAARKELKAFVGAQVERLKQALLTQRVWSVELWRTYSGHPVAGALCQRLLWCSGDDVFRVEADGRLVDVDDEPVALGDDAQVRLAHGLFLSVEQGARWAQHFADFEILPLFSQVGRPTWRPDDAAAESIPSGATGSAFRVRSTGRRLGYDLQGAGDGGYVFGLERDHPGLGVSVQLQVDDLRHPIEDVPVTVVGAVFVQEGRPVALGRLPAVLVSEVHADLGELADALSA